MKNKLFSYAKYLSEGIGNRLTASDGERKAGNFIVSKLESFGYTPKIEKFKTPKSPYELFQFVYFTGLLIIIFYTRFCLNFQIGLIVLEILLAIFFYLEFNFLHTPLFKFFQTHYSKNIYIKKEAKDKAKNKIVLNAHIDSATASILFLPKFVKYLNKNVKLTLYSLIILPLISILLIHSDFILLKLFFYLIGFEFLIGLIISFHSEYIAKPTSGANDNASSVSILLGLAEHFSNKSLNDKEVWLVFTGAEEAGCVGIYEFMKKHRKDFDNETFFITLDCTGIGEPVIVKSEGMIRKYKSDEYLLNILKNSAEEEGIKYQIQDLPVGYTEMEVIKNFGFKVVSIGAAPEDPKAVPNWHQKNDTIAYINGGTLETVYRLLLNGIEKF